MKSVLTAEEWEKREIREYGSRVFWVEGDNAYFDNSDEEYGCGSVPLVKIAALALAGQPFGFTREDVAMLRRLPLADYTDEWRYAFESLIDRIESLLPPEPPSVQPDTA